MLDQVRPRTHDAHVAEQHIPELRDFVDTELPKPFPEGINAVVFRARLPGLVRIVRAHRSEFVDLKPSILHAGAGLDVEQWPGRLDALRDPHDRGQDGKNKQHHRQ